MIKNPTIVNLQIVFASAQYRGRIFVGRHRRIELVLLAEFKIAHLLSIFFFCLSYKRKAFWTSARIGDANKITSHGTALYGKQDDYGAKRKPKGTAHRRGTREVAVFTEKLDESYDSFES